MTLFVAACQTVPDDALSTATPSLRSWGTLREALRDGKTETRVDAVEVARSGTFGVGAASGLQGGITIVDGAVVYSSAAPDGAVIMRGECPVRARTLGKEMPTHPFEAYVPRIEGEVVGLHALHSGGQMTHHGETMHAHVVLDAAVSRITAHAESFGFAKGSKVSLPAAR